jgi:hypothetical protein
LKISEILQAHPKKRKKKENRYQVSELTLISIPGDSPVLNIVLINIK